MKRFIFQLLCFLTVMPLFSQQKLFTVNDVEIGAYRELAPQTLYNLQWRGNTNSFSFQDSRDLYQQTVSEDNARPVVSVYAINAILKQSNSDTLKSLPVVTWGSDNELYFMVGSTWYCVDISGKSLAAKIVFPDKAANHSVHFQTKRIAYTLNNNLFVADSRNMHTAISSDKDPDIVNGESVSRNEFGINEGIFWSPSGSRIAYYRKDNSKVGDYPLVNVTARQAQLENIKYPMAGMSSEHISVGVFDIASQKTVFIEKNDTISEKYLTNISWSPDEKQIFIQVLNRAQNHMMLNKYSAQDGSLIKTLFEEKHSKYVEPRSKLQFLKKNPGWFLYESRRDGYNHIYVYDTEGRLIRQLTGGKWEVIRIQAIDAQDNVYYSSTEVNPMEVHFYRINAMNSKKAQLTVQPGTHRLLLQGTFQYFIDDFSSITVPRAIHLYQANGKQIRTLVNSPNRLSGYAMPEMTTGTIKSADGTTDLYYRLIKPVNFDPAKKYPAIIYVYGGPHAQLVQNRWLGGARLWEYMMAQKGYVMLTVDNRGSANRGLEFENVIHRQCGVAEMADQMEGVKFLKQTGYVDMDRLGVHGWSYGGFMVTSLMTTYPGVFKTGVAGGPVIDWKYYEVMYGERYMDTPTENPEGYQSTSLIPKAKNLKGKLLIIHGAVDPTVVWQNSLVFIEECIKNQVPVDYFVYPTAEHNVRGFDRVHLISKITSYFDDYL